MRRSIVKILYPGLDFSEDVVLADKTVSSIFFTEVVQEKKKIDSDGIEIIKSVRQHDANLRNSSYFPYVLQRNYI